MPFSFSKKLVAAIALFVAFGIGAYVYINSHRKDFPPPKLNNLPRQLESLGIKRDIIGKSVEGREIEAYIYGSGNTHLMFVGGMHGGYEWNSVLLAYKFIEYLNSNLNVIPKNMTISIIPNANPDGVFKVTGKTGGFQISDVSTNKQVLASGRFNSREVDLNRNFDCKWKPTSTWQSKTVSAGSSAFSEPEAQAIRNFVLENHPSAAIFWHSQSNAVYASECKNGILPETLDIMKAYSIASGYPGIKSFDAYEISGDAEGWLASINIPAITVELKTHETIEWEQNLAGVRALFTFYDKKLNTSY